MQSVITHLGQSVLKGHYFTYCRNGPAEDFLCYNDSIVSKATMNDAMNSNITGNSNEIKAPYILVYQQIK
mgnify:CR=1 FL=1